MSFDLSFCTTASIANSIDNMNGHLPNNGSDGHEHHEHDEIDDGPQEIFLDDDDIAELQEVLDNDDDVPMEDDDDDDDGIEDADEESLHRADGPIKDTSSRQFRGHGDSAVFAVSLHPKNPVLVLTGGEDDTGYLWRLDTGEQIAKLSGHSDSVVAVAWSSDGELAATGAMDGTVRIWRRSRNIQHETWEYSRWEFLSALEGMEEITWLDWHPSGTVLICGTGDGTVWMWKLPSGDNMNVFSGHTAATTCGKFTPDGKRLITGSEDGSFIVWDPRTGLPIYKLTASDGRFRFEGGITCLAVNAANTSAIVGGADGLLRIVNLTNGQVAQNLESHGDGESVEALAWAAGTQGSHGLWISASTDKKVKVFEASNGALRWTGEHDDAITSIALHPAASHLVSTGSVDRSVKTWDVRTGQLQRTSTGHQDVVHSVAVSADGRRVVSVSDDGSARVYEA